MIAEKHFVTHKKYQVFEYIIFMEAFLIGQHPSFEPFSHFIHI